MRIVFMGTPEFARKSLERLYSDRYDIAGVFTQEDKPRNRGMKMSFSPVKELALSKNTPVLQPTSLKDGLAIKSLKELYCDLVVVVSYGMMLPNDFLAIPPLGCINIHGSLLPKYRGASPVQSAVLNGDKETGLTSMYISEKMDSGDIILTKNTPIGDDETSGDLFERLSILSAELLSETVDAIFKGSAKRVPQNHNEATYTTLITKDMAPIEWSKSAFEIKNKVRGLQPWPVATIELNGVTLKVFSVDITTTKTDERPGSIISHGKSGIEVACGNGSVIIKELQAPGGKRMSAADYLRGNPITKEAL